MEKEKVHQKTLKVTGRLLRVDKWDTVTIKSFSQFISTFRCHYYQTEVVYYVSKMLGTDQKIWNLIVTIMREEAGGRIMEPVESEEIEIELRDDVTSEIEGLVDLAAYAKERKLSLAQMRKAFNIPQTADDRRERTLAFVDREIQALKDFRKLLTE